MNANKALWEKGDFTRLARHMRDAGAATVDAIGVDAGMKVLDLGCGDGTTAVPAARSGATVVGIDIAANLVAAGTGRAAAEGLANLSFREGDACDLAGVADGTFDLVISMFGAMFAPDPLAVARETVRVTRSGGRIVMGNWIPEDPTLVAQVLKTAAAFTPPPPAGAISPMLWGREGEVTARFAAAGVPADAIGFERATYHFDYPGSPTDFLHVFLDYYGPTMNAMAAARAEGRGDQFLAALTELFERQNRSSTPGRTEMDATYLRVTVTKP